MVKDAGSFTYAGTLESLRRLGLHEYRENWDIRQE